ncbi:MAG: hypothetical protein J0I06_20310 [Planctomycetes bacterium]|nr:hypothetical protein [Planctomycetota bacterium]
MKSSRFAVGLVGLAIVGLWYSVGGARQLPASRAAEAPPRVAAPLTHENLSVYFVHGPDAVADAKVMSLQEALDRDLAVVHETGNVNTLVIENRSPEYELFVQSGDIVKGGRQDRMAATDMLLPPRSGAVPLPAHCVEQGRWTGRGSEDARRFSSSAKCAAGKELKYANARGEQSAVWRNVAENQTKLNASLKVAVNENESPTSFQLTLESPVIQAKVAEYESALKTAGEGRDDIIGVVFAVNGQVTGAEVYGSNALFRKAWPKLLNAAAVEAVADRTDGSVASGPSAREIERFLACGASAEPTGAEADGSSLVAADNPVTVQLQVLRQANGRVLANEEAFQTEGRAVQIDGQRVQTDARNRADANLDTAAHIRPANPAPNPPYERNANPTRAAQDNIVMGGSGAARVPEPAPQPANRLSSNRTENRSTLMVESRDLGRQNAVIHRSYVSRPSNDVTGGAAVPIRR